MKKYYIWVLRIVCLPYIFIWSCVGVGEDIGDIGVWFLSGEWNPKRRYRDGRVKDDNLWPRCLR